jgi:hypothetical protein
MQVIVAPEGRYSFFDPRRNIMEGTKRLAEARDKCFWQKDYRWVICYNRGLKGGSAVVEPSADLYYRKVMNELHKRTACAYKRPSRIGKRRGRSSDQSCTQ